MTPDSEYSALLRYRQQLVEHLANISELQRLELDSATTTKEREEVEADIAAVDKEIATHEIHVRREREDVYWRQYNSMTTRLSGLAVIITLVAFILASAYGWPWVPMSLVGAGMSLYAALWRTRRYRKAIVKRIQELLESQIC